MSSSSITEFVPLPEHEAIRIFWPTPNRALFDQAGTFFARTRANANYGRPGWTRDCGRRFHRGCDIAAFAPKPTGRTTTVMFSDCERNIEFPSEEPTYTCDDEIFAVFDGVVSDFNTDEDASPLGLHVVLEHHWPSSGKRFFTLYAHLSSIEIPGINFRGGQRIGRMGQTSRSADAKNWMSIAPHLHFEALDENHRPYDPEIFLRTFLPR